MSLSLRITNLRVPVERSDAELGEDAARVLRVGVAEVLRYRILKKSLDARSPRDLRFVYTLQCDVPPAVAERFARKPVENVSVYTPPMFEDPQPGQRPLPERPVVVGTGPAGLLAGYLLAKKGYRPLLIDRGLEVKSRVPAVREFDAGGRHDPDNNYLFGEGGAGCFSDGKLTCRMEGPDVDWVLERFVECGGRPSIVYENRPHLGSNKLPMICRNFRRQIESLGGEYWFGCRLESLVLQDGLVRGLQTSRGLVAASRVILGIGHSARDTYEILHQQGVPFQQKAFQLGLRIEQSQSQIDSHKYGRPEYRALLGAADYTLQGRAGDRDLFTFCMCAGGLIIPSVSEPERFCSNGMSNSRHDTPFANSGVMVTLDPREFGDSHPLAGMWLQRKYEAAAFQLAGADYHCPIQSAREFVSGAREVASAVDRPCSYPRGTRAVALDGVLPPQVVQAIRQGLPVLDQKFGGAFLRDAILVGPEMRGSAPVRIDRDPVHRQCPTLEGLYPVGEGAGYAGGIISAAVDGLRSARALIQEFALPG